MDNHDNTDSMLGFQKFQILYKNWRVKTENFETLTFNKFDLASKYARKIFTATSTCVSLVVAKAYTLLSERIVSKMNVFVIIFHAKLQQIFDEYLQALFCGWNRICNRKKTIERVKVHFSTWLTTSSSSVVKSKVCE